jgi:hypothetical protein
MTGGRVSSRRLLLLSAFVVAVLLGTIGGLAVLGPTPADPVSPNATTVDRLHEAGITGENVTVGVVDVTGFDTDRAGLADNVVAARAFAPGETIRNGGRTGHGTAVASVVASTAPNSSLYLATFDTVEGFEAAVAWMLRDDVDVIVAPTTFYGRFSEHDSTVRNVTQRATEEGVVFVAPAGNLGRGHWEGRYRPTDDGVHRFEDGTRNRLHVDNESVLRLWLSWNRSHASEEYTAELYWTNGTADRLVARSQPYRADDVPNERIVARVGNGTYYVRITGPPNETGARLQLESPTHTLQFRSRSGSIAAPATAPEVLSVGAYARETDRVRPFSSAGPTRDGRIGVDVVAPDGYTTATTPSGFVGSSASASYVAGVTALLLDADGDRSPREVETTLEASAEDIRKSGPDTVSGYGLVRPVRAVRAVWNHSNSD